MILWPLIFTLSHLNAGTLTIGTGYSGYLTDRELYLSIAGYVSIMSAVIFCNCGIVCSCCCLCCYQKCSRSRRRKLSHNNVTVATLPSDKSSQQIKRPKPPRPPPPIYEYVPSKRPSDNLKVKEQDIEVKASESEEQHLDTPEASKAKEQDVDMKLNINEGQSLEMTLIENSEQDLEMKENIAYHPTQKIIALPPEDSIA